MTSFGKIVFGITGLVMAAGLYYGLSPRGTNSVSSEVLSSTSTENIAENFTVSTTTEEQLVASTTNKKIAFSEFIKEGGSYRCDVSQTMANMTSQGVLFIKDKKIKVEFVNTLGGQSIRTFMIIRDDAMYTWTSGAPTKGYKTKHLQNNVPSESTLQKTTYTWDGSQIGDYDCQKQNVDDSIFIIPESITFTETS